ncbi:ATP-grasp domain-containing protein [Hahella sp. CR1]|uniref:ATP-grasp domain-containing protein n=1 Tax=Hahella sp. CR1 TaxID=2992807 RepID=UPI002441DCF5|nr:ATP-grasp domain-containing protein [Hahella sp. CR1]MDG9668707.1 ATP-grasp domain-containing protein [Hahella sp. CR1]
METVAIVDPYSTGQYLAGEFISRGYHCIAVHSSNEIPPLFSGSYIRENFTDEVFLNDNYKDIVKFIKSNNCIAIVPGTESGVLLANTLANDLEMPCCDHEKLQGLRDKYVMQEIIKSAGIRSITQCRTSSISEAREFIKENKLDNVVVKPISSAGTDGVKFCKNIEDIEIALNSIINKKDKLGNTNLDILIQEYIEGSEYVVDTVSLNGSHYVVNTSIYRKVKLESGSIVYSEEEFIHPCNPEVSDIIEYAKLVLDALGISFGAAHLEIMLDKHGPVLIEVGARLHGAKAPRNIQFISNISQIDLLVDAAINPKQFFERTKEPPIWTKHSKAVALINHSNGKVIGIPGKKWAETLPSYIISFWNIELGQNVSQTSNLFDSPGCIFLAHKCKDVLENDIKRIREMELSNKLWITL